MCSSDLEPANPNAPREHIRFTQDESLQLEVEALADAAAGKAPYPVKPVEAMRNVAFLEAMMKSAASGNSWVKLAQEPTE